MKRNAYAEAKFKVTEDPRWCTVLQPGRVQLPCASKPSRQLLEWFLSSKAKSPRGRHYEQVQ
jgi:hypothetical protein